MHVDHPTMVAALAKDAGDILETLTRQRVHALHMASGIGGEAGEVLDEIKKSVMHNKPFNVQKITEELGDLEFYLEGLRQGFGITREEVITSNIKKLSKRYGKTYSDQAAHARIDKA